MRIKRTVKPDFNEAGKTEIIDENRMLNICLQCAGMTYRKGLVGSPCQEAENLIKQLSEGHQIESFYATYELVSSN